MRKALYCTSIMLFFAAYTNAQTIALKSAPANVKIDGNADEWKGYEESVNEKSHVNYIISSDKDNLYLVVKTKDRKKQQNILGAGVTFSIDPAGKKKETFTTTFPQADMDDLSEFEHLDDANLKMRVAATEFKKIRFTGPAGVPLIIGAQKNEHNFYASIKYTADGELVLEEAIPLKLLATTETPASEWAFNIKINGLFVRSGPSFGGGAPPPAVSGGGGGGRGGAPRMNSGGTANMAAMMNNNTGNLITSASDFWGKFAFAK